MSKNITISEGAVAKVFTGVNKITTNKSGSSGSVDWVPEDEAINYVDLDELDVDENGTYTASQEGCQAFSKVTVNVEPDLTTKGIDANGTYNASDDGADGYESVVVDVQPDLTTKGIDANGTYNASDDGVDGYDSVVVDVAPNVGTAKFIRNGTYHSSGEGLDGFNEVTVDVKGGGGGSISGTEVQGTATTNLNAGQTVHVYTNGQNELEPVPAVLDGTYNNGMKAIVYGGDVFWIANSNFKKKDYSYIQESGHYEQVPYNSSINLAYPFYACRESNYSSIRIGSLDNFEGKVDADLTADWGNTNGNLFLTNNALYDRSLNKIMSYPAVSSEAFYFGTRVPIDTGRYWGGTGQSGDIVSETIAAIGTWQTINTFRLCFDATTHQISNYMFTAQRKFYITHPIGSEEYDVFSISQSGGSGLVVHIPKKYLGISSMSPSGSYFIIAAYDSSEDTSKKGYKIKNDGSYEMFDWPTSDTGDIVAGEEGFFVRKVYYPYASQSGGNYISGTSSKSARGQLGVCKASVSAGSKATAIVLFT